MPARTGQQYIDGLAGHPAEVWIRGENVGDVTIHPAFHNGVRSLVALYDMQHHPPRTT
jgi:4-hydroxyphenylacetate 3-monooxygenase